MDYQLSVIVCTYNPNEQIFSRCLKSVSEAAKLHSPAEIIIVDNNSYNPLQNISYIQDFLSTNTNAKLVREEKQGLTPARMRGIVESESDIIVFIDDDNFIKEDFFLKGVQIAAANSHIGAWSGQVRLYFEKEPEAWIKKYWGLLVYREFNADMWSNFPHLPETMPCGAGLFVRRKVAEYYQNLHENGHRDIQMDRTGNSLFSGGDNDLAACACDIGMGVGLFHELMLDHYIPKTRLKKEYLLNLAQGIAASSIVFRSFRNDFPIKKTLKNRIANFLRLLLKNGTDRQFYKAVLKGENEGAMLSSRLQNKS